MKIEGLKAQVEIEKIRAQAGVKTVGCAAEGTTDIYADQVKPKLPTLPAFVDGKDDLDSWLLRLERFANTSEWPKENWCTSLSALRTGRALDVFCHLSESEAMDYDRVKEVLQKRYNLTEDGYRQKFRAGTPDDGENANMFIVRLKTYLEKWMKLFETPQTYDELRDLCIREQFLDSSLVDLSIGEQLSTINSCIIVYTLCISLRTVPFIFAVFLRGFIATKFRPNNKRSLC